jgi:hypothetical protein
MQRFLSEFQLEPFRAVEIRRYFLKCPSVETFPVNFGIKIGCQCEREDFMRLGVTIVIDIDHRADYRNGEAFEYPIVNRVMRVPE